jgi:hypothetical protein
VGRRYHLHVRPVLLLIAPLLSAADFTTSLGDINPYAISTKAPSLGLKIIQILAKQLKEQLSLDRRPGTWFELTSPQIT